MNRGLVAAALAATALMASACSGESESSANTTPTRPPLTADENSKFADKLSEQMEPCTGLGAFTTNCSRAIDSVLITLEAYGNRVPADNPRTRASVQESVAQLNYWKDACVETFQGTPERSDCVRVLIREGTATEPVFTWNQENG
ncbi:hypothetical protein GS909_07950 [Rhodococcus hoagii]|nr:hypothetical protein [Prescottella equi]NKV11064.1 hypothetical protein [Prescottella equi]